MIKTEVRGAGGSKAQEHIMQQGDAWLAAGTP